MTELQTVLVVVSVLTIVFGAAVGIAWLVKRYDVWLGPPTWQLSATNAKEGLLVELYEGDAFVPTYSAILEGRSTSQDVSRKTREELDASIARTTPAEEGGPPHRWTLTIDGVRLDVSPDRLLVDEREVVPGATVRIGGRRA